SIVALDNLGTHLLIRPYHVTPVFRVELAGESSRVHQITEHHRELTAFGFWSTRFGWWSGNRSSWIFSPDFLLSRLNDDGLRSRACFTSPDQHSPVLISSKLVDFNEFVFQRFKSLVVQVELDFERSIGRPPSVLEKGDHLVEDVVEIHYRPSSHSSNNA